MTASYDLLGQRQPAFAEFILGDRTVGNALGLNESCIKQQAYGIANIALGALPGRSVKFGKKVWQVFGATVLQESSYHRRHVQDLQDALLLLLGNARSPGQPMPDHGAYRAAEHSPDQAIKKLHPHAATYPVAPRLATTSRRSR